MKVICISSGNFNSIYINYLSKLTYCDLLIINFNVVKTSGKYFLKEIKELSKKFSCTVVVGVNFLHEQKKLIIVDSKGKVAIKLFKLGIKIKKEKRLFFIGPSYIKSKLCNKIILSDEQIKPCVRCCSYNKIYLFCDRFGTTVVKNKKLKRKFNKCSKFILK